MGEARCVGDTDERMRNVPYRLGCNTTPTTIHPAHLRKHSSSSAAHRPLLSYMDCSAIYISKSQNIVFVIQHRTLQRRVKKSAPNFPTWDCSYSHICSGRGHSARCTSKRNRLLQHSLDWTGWLTGWLLTCPASLAWLSHKWAELREQAAGKVWPVKDIALSSRTESGHHTGDLRHLITTK